MKEPNNPLFYRGLLDSLLEGVYFVDRELRISYWNRGAEPLTGYAASEAVGLHCYDDVMVHTDKQGRPLCHSPECPAARVMQQDAPWEELVYLRHREGHRVPVLTRITPMRNKRGEVIGAVELFADASRILEERKRVQVLEQAALIDPLTGVGNRRFGEMVLQDRLSSLDRYGLAFGIVLADVDRFKQINDKHGHAAGDAALRMVASTLRHSIRASDVVARWGGDEFLIVLTGCLGPELEKHAQKMRRLVEESGTEVSTGIVKVTVSMGAVSVPSASVTSEKLVARADMLLYQAKKRGRNRVKADRAEMKSSG
jgi:diguanylate cyclase (GGDEF)-like protein/PAS domain S-box-containing protein